MSFDRHPNFSSPRLPLGTRLFFCLFMSLSLLIADSYFGWLDSTRQVLTLPFSPFQWLSNQPKSLLSGAEESLKLRWQLEKENKTLRQQSLNQSVQLSRMKTVERELNELKQLTGLYKYNVAVLGVAEVLSTGNDPFVYRLNIDSNQTAKFKVGLPVLDSQGLLGLITSVQTMNSEVTLAINKGFMVPVMIERTGERSILYGYGGGVELPYLPQHSDIKVGDRLVTSGLDGVYPSGLPVAKITAVKRNSSAAFAKVTCQALAGMRRARYVLVIDQTPVKISADGAKKTSAEIIKWNDIHAAGFSAKISQPANNRISQNDAP